MDDYYAPSMQMEHHYFLFASTYTPDEIYTTDHTTSYTRDQ